MGLWAAPESQGWLRLSPKIKRGSGRTWLTHPAERRRAPSRVAARSRVRPIALGFILGLTLLGARLFQLQVVQYSNFAVQSNSNYQRDDIVRAVRGEIRTRDGVLLATNRLAVDLIYKGRSDPNDPEQAIANWDKIRYIAHVPPSQLTNGQPREPDRSKETEVYLARNIKEENLAALYEYTVLIPSLELRERIERIYPKGKMAAHLLGYVQEATEHDVSERGFTIGDLVGKSGIEASLQETLQGKNGLRRSEVTAKGKPLTERIIDPGQKGKDVVLTIDSRLQIAAETALREGLADVNAGRLRHGAAPEPYTRGAIIAYDPRTNEVLAMASAPAYDPNWFSRVPSPDRAARNWAVDPNRPNSALDAVMSNRVVQPYEPGSVFKIASTLMYVEKWGNFTTPCVPAYRFGGSYFKNWAGYSLGPVDGRLAIAFSCNPWYYHSAVLATPEAYTRQLKARLTELGYNRPTGLELIGEPTGHIYDDTDFTRLGAKFYPGMALNMSIGQGDVKVSPAQVAWVMSTIINEGQQRPLTLLKAIDGQAQPRKPITNVVRKGNTESFKLVKEGMSYTTSIRNGWSSGTATHEIGPALFPVRTGGKTGTAENGMSYNKKNYTYTHAWYEGYGPLYAPNFAVVAFFQYGGEGSGPALRAVKKMFAARWCVRLSDTGSALPLSEQQPCMGELSQMHEVMKKREARAQGQQ